MVALTGVLGVVKAATNTIAEITSFSIDESANMISDSQLTDAAETSIAGRNSWSGTIECMWDDADTNGQAAMTIGASLAFEFQPEGGASGANFEYQGTGLIESRGLSVADESMITQSFTIKGTGALVIGTVA